MSLLLRSPVFRSMLTLDMEEKRSREVHMEDAEVEVVRELVKYLYTADISPGFARLEDLLVLANRSEGGTGHHAWRHCWSPGTLCCPSCPSAPPCWRPPWTLEQPSSWAS